MITFRSTPSSLPLPPPPPSLQKKKEAGVTNKAQAMTCYRYFRVSYVVVDKQGSEVRIPCFVRMFNSWRYPQKMR